MKQFFHQEQYKDKLLVHNPDNQNHASRFIRINKKLRLNKLQFLQLINYLATTSNL